MKEKFLKEYADYVNATILHMEITNKRNSINFEEEAEWVADWWLSEIRADICHCNNVDFGSYANTVGMVAPWNKKIVYIDTCIATKIGYLWHQTITTLNSCCGHNKLPPTVVVAEESVEKMVALGYKHYKGEVMNPHQTFLLSTPTK